ncbi:MAG TPA: hypothetical protein VK892_15570 [Pyrinomonadaceae bacterium]|nr:hypothetical protein [Pyrinomonadaceae bacterium]
MKKFIFVILLLAQVSSIFAQTSGNLYEVEILLSKGTGKRDTREVNAVVVFEKEKVKIKSRRGSEVFKEFNYSEITEVQHTFARSPKFKVSGKDVALTLLTGFPVFLFSQKKERNWVTILGNENFAVLKAENDNFRQLIAEFAVRKIKIVSQDEDNERELN